MRALKLVEQTTPTETEAQSATAQPTVKQPSAPRPEIAVTDQPLAKIMREVAQLNSLHEKCAGQVTGATLEQRRELAIKAASVKALATTISETLTGEFNNALAVFAKLD